MTEDRRLPLDVVLGVPEEIAFFVRSAIYGIAVTVVYWFMTYEVAGTVLLGAFGGVSAAIAAYLFLKRPSDEAMTARRDGPRPRGAPPAAEGPFGDDPGLAPNPILAPLEIGFGIMLALFAIPFGLWMAIAAVVPIAAGSIAWLDAITEEQRRIFDRETPDVAGDEAGPPGRPAQAREGEASEEAPPGTTIRQLGIVAAGAAGVGLLSVSNLGRRIILRVIELIGGIVGILLGAVLGERLRRPDRKQASGSRSDGPPRHH